MLAWVMNMGFAASPANSPPPVTLYQHSRRKGHFHDTVLRVVLLCLIIPWML